MHITKLRLLGFKSFVEPTELVIERGLTGVVGPNGCGKSNLLEALRWVMGETSYKSMRASSMEDVIFNGTNLRPPRNMAEVTMFLDNSDRRAPAGFNDNDVLEVTRRIERDMGSAYRVNSVETRARDIKILFEDAATGARSPALVRQGQIAEIVNAKPEQRRRILEDAAGVAGLHSRRHDAELRLKAAEANLGRVGDVLGQLGAQVESLKRQARQARRYKELSAEIRRTEALVMHLAWIAAKADVDGAEHALTQALETLGVAVTRESELTRLEAEIAAGIEPLREEEVRRAAALHRLKVEQETFEREAQRSAARQAELEATVAHLRRDIEREDGQLQEARSMLAALGTEQAEIEATSRVAVDFEERAAAALTAATAAVGSIEQRLAAMQAAAAEARARRRSLEAQKTERTEARSRLERQLAALEQQAREVTARAPDLQKLKATTDLGQQLMGEIADIETQSLEAEERLAIAAREVARRREAASAAVLSASQVKTEADTLLKLLKPSGEGGFELVVDQISVETGYEMALGAALGDDLEAAASEEAAVHWRHVPGDGGDPALPDGVEPLSQVVKAPQFLQRRLAQIGLVTRDEGDALQPRLRPGQRLVTREGDLWRWDGFVAGSHGSTAAATRLEQRNRLGALMHEVSSRQAVAATCAAAEAAAAEAWRAAEAEDRRLRQLGRDTQSRLAQAREALSAMERQARETEARLASVGEARERLQDALAEAVERLMEVDAGLETLVEADPFEEQLVALQEEAADKRSAVADARAEIATLERERRHRGERGKQVAAEIERWRSRIEATQTQAATLKDRIETAVTELEEMSGLPQRIAERREQLLSALTTAEAERNQSADKLAEADTQRRDAAQKLRAAQEHVSAAREARARVEARLEAARARRQEEARRIREALDCGPDDCLAAAGLEPGAALPQLADVERELTRARTDRDRLGGVNLAADDDLQAVTAQFEALDKERADVEEAIAKLRAAIGQLNREAKGRLADAFEKVNAHFQHLFGVLFGGGEARLEMIQSEEDPLEGGLEIVAKPPGKKPATLSLLSGGEQTLTALSLIFAVFLTNPSPICVLDEVDAPLDDANVDRFCTMMERMATGTETRFLVITHHPMTMARMNRLFGVTMAERGVSQLVSVDLETARSFREAAA